MKTIGKLIRMLVLILPLMVGGLSVRAASEEDIEASIESGLQWLAAQQQPDGCWYGWSTPADTGLATWKFEERATELLPPLDPFDPAYVYHSQVENGLDCIFSMVQESGGLVWLPGLSTYETGIDMIAVAASRAPSRIVSVPGSPVDGWTYQQVLAGMLDWMEDAQNDGTPGCECDEGGWTYGANGACSSDQSNTGYATMGAGFATAPVLGFGLSLDPNVLAKLGIFMDNVQRADGGSDYNSCGLWNQSNTLRTGNLLYEMALVGRPVDAPTVQAAVGFIEAHWSDTCDPGWQGDYQATFTMTKGLQAFAGRLDTLPVVGDWFDQTSTYIVDHQNLDGSWGPGCGFGAGDPVLVTSWALLSLEPTAFIPPNQPPDCSAAAPSIGEIWPPNHKMVGVNVLGVTDPEGAPVSIVITGITQDEPVNGLGDGDTSPDGAGVDTDTAQVRAERAGTPKVPGNGRVYHIHFKASDDMGGACSGVVKVGVPHDQRRGHVIVDGGELYDSTLP
ncbi:MAG: hypothetical protein MUP14_09185 [Dehalococcoidia bacterium]|nr:hypothetical protein [Dehalococcoidia bacterium]